MIGEAQSLAFDGFYSTPTELISLMSCSPSTPSPALLDWLRPLSFSTQKPFPVLVSLSSPPTTSRSPELPCPLPTSISPMTPKCPGQSPSSSILPTHHSLSPDQPQMSLLLGASDLRLCSEFLGDGHIHATISEHREPLSFDNTLPYPPQRPP